MSLIQKIAKKDAWTKCEWEFYQNLDGNWVWRASAPESWCKENGIKLPTAQTIVANKNTWEKTQKEPWYEVARSSNGYSSKTECEKNALEWGWKKAS